MNFNRNKSAEKTNSRFSALKDHSPESDRRASPPRHSDEPGRHRNQEHRAFSPKRGGERRAYHSEDQQRHSRFMRVDQGPKQIPLDTKNEDQFPPLGGTPNQTTVSQQPDPEANGAITGSSWAALAARPIDAPGSTMKFRTDGSGRRVPIDAPETPYEREVRLLAERRAAQIASQRRRQAAIDAGEDYYSESDDDSRYEYVEEEVYASDEEYYDDEDGW